MVDNGSAGAPRAQRVGEPRLPPGDEAAWDVSQVAYYLGVSPSLVRKLEALGKLPAQPRISRRLTFEPAAVRAFRSGNVTVGASR